MGVEREGTLIRFTCDGDKCHKNYESVDGFGNAWPEAKAHGWVNAMGVRDSITEWKHYCPKCKLELGDD